MKKDTLKIKSITLYFFGILIATFFFSASSFGTTYYVSNAGSDANPGTTPEKAWKSLERVNEFIPKPGDSILFSKGDEWVGTITVNMWGLEDRPLVYGAYGVGDKPKIYGSEKITGWTQHSGNIYKTTVNDNIAQLFLNGKRMKLARYPNKGYFYVTSVNTNTQFTSTEISGSIDYSGATWIGRTSAYALFHTAVTSSNSQTIILESAPDYSLNVGEGFFLTDKMEFLDSAGEWYYDEENKTLYLWTPNGDSPANYTVRGSVEDYGIYLANKNYVTIKDIEILHSSHTGIFTTGSSNVTVDNTRIISPDQYGIFADASPHTYTNNYIYQAGGGIRATSSTSTYTDNIIEDTGLFENINKRVFTHDNYGTAIYLRNGNPTVQYNRIINTGYGGINWRGVASIKYNYINGAMSVLGDGGAIYSYNKNTPAASSGSEVMYNIVENVHGNREGFTKDKDDGHGIFMDDETTGVTIKYNTVFNASCGIFLHVAGNTTVKYNTVYDALVGLLTGQEYSKNYFYDNLVFAADRPGDFTWWTNQPQKLVVRDGSAPDYDRNEYYHAYATDVFRSGSNRIFSDWKSTTGQDVNSNFKKIHLNMGETEQLFFNDTKQKKLFNLGTCVYRDLYGKQVTGKFYLEPFTSRILIKTTQLTTGVNN